jgi:hypothetical protein
MPGDYPLVGVCGLTTVMAVGQASGVVLRDSCSHSFRPSSSSSTAGLAPVHGDGQVMASQQSVIE